MDRTMERWKRLGIVLALLTVAPWSSPSMRQFQQLILHPFAFIGAIVLAVAFSIVILRVALVPEQRYVSWTRAIIGPNGRWLFLILILLWGAGMAFLASLGLGPQQTGRARFPWPVDRHLPVHGVHLGRHRRVAPRALPR